MSAKREFKARFLRCAYRALLPSRSLDLCFTVNAASRNLWDYENREVYESSHSVVLALLAAHAQRIGDGSGGMPSAEVEQTTAVARPPAEKFVPFYTNCLLEVQSLM